MARFFSSLVFAVVGFLLASVSSAAPAVVAERAAALLSVGEIINLLGIGLVKDINVFISLDSLVTNLVSINFDVKNPLPIELTIDRISTAAGINGTVFASFDHTFSTPLVVPILGTKNSGTIDNVLLTQGATASLNIIPLGELDLISTNASVRAATINGKLGIPIPIDGLKQSDVLTNYTLTLS